MDIRSITIFSNWDALPDNTADFLAAGRAAFPYPVQSARAAFPPFPDWLPLANLNAAISNLQSQLPTLGLNYASLGPVQLDHDPAWLAAIPRILSQSDALFVTAEIADGNGRVSPARCHQIARLIQQISTLQANGFGNLYFAALANCPPGSPFFPVAYHDGGAPGFALAIEAADLAQAAIAASRTLADARANLVAAIETAAAAISAPAAELAAQYGLAYRGLDFSLAPYPTADKSLAGALEALGLPHLGAHGSLFAAGFVTEAIGRARFPRCGFSGLMLPVLEDSILAQRAGDGLITVQDLLSYAAVCGVGLDTVPLPGDINAASLAGILLDVAMLATRLGKPLTARLMPLPGLAAGDAVQFDFPYFAPSRVMAVSGAGVTGLMADGERPSLLDIHKINR
ncbi:MAG: DUF711 family protein [Chloroflexi bacterium]|nr:DUF711 family protein [Chloroflexota bacterium]